MKLQLINLNNKLVMKCKQNYQTSDNTSLAHALYCDIGIFGQH